MRAILLGTFLMLFGVGCDLGAPGPIYVFGTADPRSGSGTVRGVSKSFKRKEVRMLHERLNSPEFQSQLTRYSCGDPVPKIAFTLSLWPEGKYQERHIEIQPRPMFSAGGRTRCLNFGLSYLLDLEVAAFDHGEPINYHYHDPLSGKEFLPESYARDRPAEPQCDCSKAGSGTEWVTWPAETGSGEGQRGGGGPG